MSDAPRLQPSDEALAEALACVAVGPDDFDLSSEVALLKADDPGVGAVVAFVGTVREWQLSGATVPSVMTLEHYPGMTERSIARIVVEARRRFDVRRVRVIHRVGPLAVSDQIVLVAVTSAHRGEAFQCAEFLMDWLKTQAPFWKKESGGEGARWVDARVSDDEAAARWGGAMQSNLNVR